MLIQRLRFVGFAGTHIVGCIWLLVSFCALVVVSWGLWDAMNWPDWVLWVGFILLFIRLDLVLFVMLFIAFIAGFFKGAWQWSLAVPGLIAFAFLGNVVLGLILQSF